MTRCSMPWRRRRKFQSAMLLILMRSRCLNMCTQISSNCSVLVTEISFSNSLCKIDDNIVIETDNDFHWIPFNVFFDASCCEDCSSLLLTLLMQWFLKKWWSSMQKPSNISSVISCNNRFTAFIAAFVVSVVSVLSSS